MTGKEPEVKPRTGEGIEAASAKAAFALKDETGESIPVPGEKTPEAPKYPQDAEGRFFCKHCDKYFKSASTVDRHLREKKEESTIVVTEEELKALVDQVSLMGGQASVEATHQIIRWLAKAPKFEPSQEWKMRASTMHQLTVKFLLVKYGGDSGEADLIFLLASLGLCWYEYTTELGLSKRSDSGTDGEREDSLSN